MIRWAVIFALCIGCTPTHPHVWSALPQEPVNTAGVVRVETAATSGSGAVVMYGRGYWYAATAAHCALSPDTLEVDGRPAALANISIANDLAIIRWRSVKKYPIYPLAHTKVGAKCRLVGYPKIREDTRECRRVVMYGHVTRNMGRWIWTNTGADFGFSGGPVLDEQNRIVGIMTVVTDAHGHPNFTMARAANASQVMYLLATIP